MSIPPATNRVTGLDPLQDQVESESCSTSASSTSAMTDTDHATTVVTDKGLDASNADQTVVLVSQTHQRFDVPRCSLRLSKLVQTMAEGDPDETVFHLAYVSSRELDRIMKFMNKFAKTDPPEVEKPLKDSNPIVALGPWYAEFTDLSKHELFELVKAANYMSMKELIDVTCGRVATMIKGKTPDEIRELFEILDTQSAEEKKALADKYAWAKQ